VNDIPDTEPNQRKREHCLSPDGKWRSFPKVPNLPQYVSNSNYYDRIKVGGKLIRECLEYPAGSARGLPAQPVLSVVSGLSQAPGPSPVSGACPGPEALGGLGGIERADSPGRRLEGSERKRRNPHIHQLICGFAFKFHLKGRWWLLEQARTVFGENPAVTPPHTPPHYWRGAGLQLSFVYKDFHRFAPSVPSPTSSAFCPHGLSGCASPIVHARPKSILVAHATNRFNGFTRGRFGRVKDREWSFTILRVGRV
jgi:hypothetical protein